MTPLKLLILIIGADVLRFTLRNKTINYFPAECANCSTVFLCEKHTPAAFVFKMTS